jgi:hypothetical protein
MGHKLYRDTLKNILLTDTDHTVIHYVAHPEISLGETCVYGSKETPARIRILAKDRITSRMKGSHPLSKNLLQTRTIARTGLLTDTTDVSPRSSLHVNPTSHSNVRKPIMIDLDPHMK